MACLRRDSENSNERRKKLESATQLRTSLLVLALGKAPGVESADARRVNLAPGLGFDAYHDLLALVEPRDLDVPRAQRMPQGCPIRGWS